MEIVSNNRTPVILLSGLDRAAIERAADAFAVAGTTLVHHDLRDLAAGVVIRTLRSVDTAGVQRHRSTRIELEHGCASCTLRGDLLPLLRRLHRRSNVDRIVLALDPSLEPEAVSWAIDHVVVADMPGFVDGPAALDVDVSATVTCVAEMDWLESATGDIPLAESGVFGADAQAVFDDDRTLAQVAVGQVAFADALVIAGADPAMRDNWSSARTMAVLRRLAPRAPIVMELPQRPISAPVVAALLDAIEPTARRGRVDDPHGSLLAGQPPLDAECGVQLVEFHADRPFHPERLHEALDVLLDGVVRTRGRVWLATRGDHMLWVESAGGALQIAQSERWLAASTPEELARADPEHRAMAAMRWSPHHGDRHTSIVVLAHRADPEEICSTLRAACLDDAEMADGPALWAAYPDPFGEFHADPCEPTAADHDGAITRGEDRR